MPESSSRIGEATTVIGAGVANCVPAVGRAAEVGGGAISRVWAAAAAAFFLARSALWVSAAPFLRANTNTLEVAEVAGVVRAGAAEGARGAIGAPPGPVGSRDRAALR